MGPTKNMEHSTSQLKSSPDAARPRRGSLPDLKSGDKADKKVPTGPRANPLYKTRLCMNYQSTGSCPYTDKCQFAHGVKELEKWESWRTSHKTDKESDQESEGSRSRSQSLEKAGRSMSGSSHDFSLDLGSPLASRWDLQTPVKRGSSLGIDETTPLSAPSSGFSLWSTMLDDLEIDRPVPWGNRPRAATFDSTYDNISQLRDAPTLFPSPPVLPSFSRLNLSH